MDHLRMIPSGHVSISWKKSYKVFLRFCWKKIKKLVFSLITKYFDSQRDWIFVLDRSRQVFHSEHGPEPGNRSLG